MRSCQYLHQKKYFLLVLTDKHIKQFAVFYLCCFLISYLWQSWYGLLFTSISPIYFLNRADVVLNLLFLTDFQHYIIENRWLQILLDSIYLVLPILLVYSVVKSKNLKAKLALLTAIFSFIYNLFFSTMSFVSIEVFLPWMLIPLLFYPKNLQGFYFTLQAIRIVVIITFSAAAIWKFVSGAIFNVEQMSSVLLIQHATYLAAGSNNMYSNTLLFLIKHTALSYLLYLAAFFIEGIFLIGLYTRKFDKYLVILFCLFLFFDYTLMGINYFSWLVFMGCFYFSSHKLEN